MHSGKSISGMFSGRLYSEYSEIFLFSLYRMIRFLLCSVGTNISKYLPAGSRSILTACPERTSLTIVWSFQILVLTRSSLFSSHKVISPLTISAKQFSSIFLLLILSRDTTPSPGNLKEEAALFSCSEKLKEQDVINPANIISLNIFIP